ncbi:MAG: Chromosome initiation inhibitor [uncultured Paraburkholderia sp.]|nr:MAG: Chromosome initiation inhibitor [uncultured Paraburkholderia sp.]
MDRFAQVEFFVLTADLGSLTRAAERLGLSNAAASRMLSARSKTGSVCGSWSAPRGGCGSRMPAANITAAAAR